MASIAYILTIGATATPSQQVAVQTIPPASNDPNVASVEGLLLPNAVEGIAPVNPDVNPFSNDASSVMSVPINQDGTIGIQVSTINPGQDAFSILNTIPLSIVELQNYPALSTGIAVVENNLKTMEWFAPAYKNLITQSEFDQMISTLPFTDISDRYNGLPVHGLIIERDSQYYLVLVGG